MKLNERLNDLRTRLAAVEAERDALRSKLAEFDFGAGGMIAQVEQRDRRIAELTAERDAAQKRVQDCETRMMRYAIELAEILGPDAAIDLARGGGQ